MFSHPKLVFFTFSRERKKFDLEVFLHRCEIFTGLEYPIPFCGVAKNPPHPVFAKDVFENGGSAKIGLKQLEK